MPGLSPDTTTGATGTAVDTVQGTGTKMGQGMGVAVVARTGGLERGPEDELAEQVEWACRHSFRTMRSSATNLTAMQSRGNYQRQNCARHRLSCCKNYLKVGRHDHNIGQMSHNTIRPSEGLRKAALSVQHCNFVSTSPPLFNAVDQLQQVFTLQQSPLLLLSHPFHLLRHLDYVV